VFSVCTPYTPPHKEYLSIEDLVKGSLPQFAYQIHLASGEVEKSVNDEQSIRQFLKGMYGARGPNREASFDPYKGVLGDNLPKIGESRLLHGKVSSPVFCISIGRGELPDWDASMVVTDKTRCSTTMLRNMQGMEFTVLVSCDNAVYCRFLKS
jgi:hypothetical protein